MVLQLQHHCNGACGTCSTTGRENGPWARTTGRKRMAGWAGPESSGISVGSIDTIDIDISGSEIIIGSTAVCGPVFDGRSNIIFGGKLLLILGGIMFLSETLLQ